MIPFRLFDLFEREIDSVAAWERLHAARAAAHGYAIAMNGKSPGVAHETEKLAKQAFPQVTIPDDADA